MNRMRSLLLAVACVAVTGPSLTACDPAPPDPAVVMTDKGPVRGAVADDHRSFQAIPYAMPPTGELRWASPRDPAPWRETRDATSPGPLCAQNGLELGLPSEQEDCLTLNVTTPRRPSAHPRPVLVWVHGGSFKDGGGSMYGGARMAALGDVVVVTINYRLGAFGFFAHPALGGPDTGSGNVGLEDQQAALRWVRHNAAAFGGDPGAVTLAGESGGGTAVCAHLAAPASRGLFHRVIMQSNDCTTRWSEENSAAPRSAAVAERQGSALAERLGCTDPATAAGCLRARSVAEVRSASGDGDGVGPVFGTPVLPVSPADALATGRTHPVPVLYGINRDEERFRVYGNELAGGGPTRLADYRAELEGAFGLDAAAVRAEYPCAQDACAPPALAAALTDAHYAYPAMITARQLAGRAPTYLYEFADRDAPWFTGFPPPGFSPGAYHTAELPYLFDVPWAEPLPPPQLQLAQAMIGYWTRFARTGDPNGGGTPRWPDFGEPHETVQKLTPGRGGIHPSNDFAAEHHLPFWASRSTR